MIRFNRKQLIKSQENCFKSKSKDTFAMLIIAQVAVLVVSIILALIVSYVAALLLEAAVMVMTSYMYVNESIKMGRISKGEKQHFESMEITIGEIVIEVEGELCNTVDTDEKALAFAIKSGANSLKIVAEYIEKETETTVIKIEEYLQLMAAKSDAKSSEKSKKNKRTKVIKNDEINQVELTNISKYYVMYCVEIKEIKKVREHKGFIGVSMKDGSEIKAPIDSENQKFYEDLALLCGKNYKIVR